MKKLITIIALYLALFLNSCLCPNVDSTSTYIKIETVRSILFSFDENGVFPYLDEINRNELGISILEDSVSERIACNNYRSSSNALYACEEQNTIIYTNEIDSVRIFTLYPFDSTHPAGADVEDILLFMDDNGEPYEISDLSEVQFQIQHFKFAVPPDFDTLQFKVTGKLTSGESFEIRTNRIVID